MTVKASLRKSVRNLYNIFQFAVGSKAFVRVNSKGRKAARLKWEVAFSQDDFSEKYINLVRGLDDKSISTVNRIIARQKAILTSNNEFLDLLTTDEQRDLCEQKERLNDLILQLSDNVFAYKNYLLPIKDFSACVFYYKYGLKEMGTLAHVRGKTIIDAGGYIGDSALLFEELEPDKICVFEASPDTFKLLKRTIKLNDLKNVLAENVALGATNGECTLYLGEINRGNGIIKHDFLPYRREITVPAITLDDYVARHKIDNIGLIKTDIEGAEPDFLAGAKKTICQQKPILLISIYHNAHDFFEIKPLIESWDLGYKFKIYKPTFALGNILDNDTLLIAEIV